MSEEQPVTSTVRGGAEEAMAELRGLVWEGIRETRSASMTDEASGTVLVISCFVKSQDCDKIIVQAEIKEESLQPNGKTDLMKNSGESSTLKTGLSERKQKLVVLANQNSQKSCSVPFDTPLSPILPFQPATSRKRQSKELPAESIQTIEDENKHGRYNSGVRGGH
ncbi:UNVERIFIED_CONTAM: hypothetical protein K2H54_061043 [Gekko kuhli]